MWHCQTLVHLVSGSGQVAGLGGRRAHRSTTAAQRSMAAAAGPWCHAGRQRVRTQVRCQVSGAQHAAQRGGSQASVPVGSFSSRGQEAADDAVPRKAHDVPVVAQDGLNHLRSRQDTLCGRSHSTRLHAQQCQNICCWRCLAAGTAMAHTKTALCGMCRSRTPSMPRRLLCSLWPNGPRAGRAGACLGVICAWPALPCPAACTVPMCINSRAYSDEVVIC